MIKESYCPWRRQNSIERKRENREELWFSYGDENADKKNATITPVVDDPLDSFSKNSENFLSYLYSG